MPNEKMIIDSLNKLFRGEVLTCVLFALLIVVAIIVILFVHKTYVSTSVFKSVLLILLVCICSIGLTVLRAMSFAPVYKDYKYMSYTVEENVQIFIVEGTTNIWEQTNDAILTNQDGEEVRLKIINDYKYDTGINYRATVVYANNSKYILWYEFSPIA